MSEGHYIGGFHAVTAVVEEGRNLPEEILLSDSRRDERSRRLLILAKDKGVRVRIVLKADLDLLAPELRHQGVLAFVASSGLVDESVLDGPATPDRLLLVLDGVQDPHNLGACIRTAEAAGVSAVIVPKDRASGLTPIARKVAAGAAERVPVITVTNLSRTLEQLREKGYWVTGLAGEATKSLYEADLSGPVVLVMGAEGQGMRRLTRENCDHLVRIPMEGRIESLNVSVAAAVCLYEAVRQRRFRSS